MEIAGHIIPAEQKVLIFLAAANCGPRRWDDRPAFRIARNTSGHLGFGYGIHQCLGQMVARLEIELLLRAMLEHFSGIVLAQLPQRRSNNTLYAYTSLLVEVVGQD